MDFDSLRKRLPTKGLVINEKAYMTGDFKNQRRVFNQGNVKIIESSNGYGETYIVLRDFKQGELVMMGFGELIDHQTERHSMQIGHQSHFLPDIWGGKFWNHSCEPNTVVSTREDGFPDLVAKRPIEKGEEVTFAYYTSEFRWSDVANENFIRCSCGQPSCKGRILSYSQLSEEEKQALRESGHLSRYLLQL